MKARIPLTLVALLVPLLLAGRMRARVDESRESARAGTGPERHDTRWKGYRDHKENTRGRG